VLGLGKLPQPPLPAHISLCALAGAFLCSSAGGAVDAGGREGNWGASEAVGETGREGGGGGIGDSGIRIGEGGSAAGVAVAAITAADRAREAFKAISISARVGIRIATATKSGKEARSPIGWG
jgi:hypothetical protein